MPKPTLGSRASAVREGVADLCEQRVDPDDLVHEVAERLRCVVPYDSGTWMTNDPETLLPTGLHTVGRSVGVHVEEVRGELVGTDVNRFVDLAARGITPIIVRRGKPHGSGLGTQRWPVERTFAWLHQFRRLRARWERRVDIHQAFLGLACSIICLRKLRGSF